MMTSDRPGRILTVTGTTTDVGKTIVTAALAAAFDNAGVTVAVCKPAQTGVEPGEPGDLDVITTLAGERDTVECVRYPEPLAPATAARRAGLPTLDVDTVEFALRDLAEANDLVLTEGAGGIKVRFADDVTLLDIAARVGADVVVVVPAGLGALNHAELTVDAIRAAGLRPAGLVIGAWPDEPDLASVCNRTDLHLVTGVPVVGIVPAGAGRRSPVEFRRDASSWFDENWLRSIFLDNPITSPLRGEPISAQPQYTQLGVLS